MLASPSPVRGTKDCERCTGFLRPALASEGKFGGNGFGAEWWSRDMSRDRSTWCRRGSCALSFSMLSCRRSTCPESSCPESSCPESSGRSRVGIWLGVVIGVFDADLKQFVSVWDDDAERV